MLYLKRQHDSLLVEIEKEKIFKDIVLILNFMFLNLYMYTS